MKKIIFLFAIILFFTPLKIVFSQYGGFNDSPFKEGALVTAVKTGKLKDIITALNSGASLNEKDFDEVNKTLNKVIKISDEINRGRRLGYSGKKITDVVNIGIGGSHLGPDMVTEALSCYSKGIKPHFISNIDPDFTSKLLEKINPETTIFIIVSKTFTTIETLENANKIRAWFIDNASKDSIKDHFIFISNNTEAP